MLYRNILRDTVRSPVPNVINSAPVIDVPVVVNDASNILIKGNEYPGWDTGTDPVAVDENTASDVAVEP